MSSAGRAASSSGCVARPRGHETGLTGYAESIQHSSPTGSSVMETAEHREPYEPRGSRTDLGAPRGESPLGDSTQSGPSIGPELSQACRPFGSDVTIIEAEPDHAAEQVPGCIHTLYRRSRLRTVSECYLPPRAVCAPPTVGCPPRPASHGLASGVVVEIRR